MPKIDQKWYRIKSMLVCFWPLVACYNRREHSNTCYYQSIFLLIEFHIISCRPICIVHRVKFRICIRHREKFWAFTGPKMDFGMILLILNMIIQRNFTGPTHFLSANVLGPVSYAVSDACLMFRPWITSLHEIFTILIQHYTCNVDFLKARSQGISRHGTGTCIDLKAGIFISQHHHDQKS